MQRRKRGIEQVKGVETRCDRCSSTIIKTSRTHRLCDTCGPIAANDYSREYQRNKHRAEGREQVGSLKACVHCAATFKLARKGRQIYCEDCMELSKAKKLPSARAWMSAWRRRRFESDPGYAINERMRRGVLRSIGDNKAGRPWETLVGYTVAELMRHLERQFVPGMTWDNRDRWHVDHIVPLASFEFETAECEGFRAAWALTNLRPLWAKDNLDKKAKRLFLL